MRWITVILASFALASASQAEDFGEAVDTELVNFESEMDGMNQRLAAPSCRQCPQSQVTFGAELAILRVYGADRVMVGDDNDVSAQETGKGIRYGSADAGFRTYLGYEAANGVGIMGSYFRLESDADLVTSTIPGDSDTVQGFAGETRFETFDLALTQRTCFRSWAFMLSGGVRGGRFKTNSVMGLEDSGGAPANDTIVASENRFEGWGPSFGLAAKRPSLCNLNVFTNLNASVLFGNSKEYFEDVSNGGGPAHLEDVSAVVPVLQTQLGVDWSHDIGPGTFSLGTALEAQAWLGVGAGPDTQYDPGGNNIGADGTPVGLQDDIGLVGVTLSAGYNF